MTAPRTLCCAMNPRGFVAAFGVSVNLSLSYSWDPADRSFKRPALALFAEEGRLNCPLPACTGPSPQLGRRRG